MVKEIPTSSFAESATSTVAESANNVIGNRKNNMSKRMSGHKLDKIRLEMQSTGILPRINIDFSDKTLQENSVKE